MYKKVAKYLSVIIVFLVLVVVVASGSVFATQHCNTDAGTGVITCDNSTNVYVAVEATCSIGRDGSGEYSGALNRNSSIEITGSNFTTVCNGSLGHAIYAVGFSNNEIGNTDLVSNNDQSNNIKTDGEESNWKVKLSSDGDNSYTIDSFSDYSQIPSSYTRVAYYPYNNIGSSGSTITPSYKITTSTSQATGEYAGKVKYTLVPTAYTLSKTIYDLKYLQDFASLTSSQKDDVLESMIVNSQYQLLDSRDEKSYYIAKLIDGDIWMTQNLDIDLDSNRTYTPNDTDITRNWSPNLSTYPANDHTWHADSLSLESYDPGNRCWDGVISSDHMYSLDDISFPCTERTNYQLGNYYKWYTAAAMDGDLATYLNESPIDDNSGEVAVDQSICPAGWKLPGPEKNESYWNMVFRSNIKSGSDGNIQLNPTYFVYGGFWGDPSIVYGGAMGIYPTNTILPSRNRIHALYFDSSGNLMMTSSLYQLSMAGLPVRCVLR